VPNPTLPPTPCIAVFDSGFGGLTVLRELLPLIPGARFLYLGDTARLPYGAKSRQTIARYALSSAAFLLAQGAEMLVVACNTASALALDELTAALPIPVVGVIQPGVHAAAALHPTPYSLHPSVLVLATAATVQSGAYGRPPTKKPARCWSLWSKRAGSTIPSPPKSLASTFPKPSTPHLRPAP
jgi:glutamate racemase